LFAYDREGSAYCVFTGLVSYNTVQYRTHNSLVVFFLSYLFIYLFINKNGLDTTGEKEKRTSKKNVNGRRTSCHDNKKFRTRSLEKQRGMAFGFRKTATAV